MRFFYSNNNFIAFSARGLRSMLVLLLICASCLPGISHALGIKEPVLKSYINERLNLEIPVTLTKQEQNSDIVIHQIVGKNDNIKEWVPDLKFNLISDYDDNYTILATTDLPIREPIVHFIISIDTGLNWIQREMSFLLDPKPVQDLAARRAKNTLSTFVLKPSEALPRDSLPGTIPAPTAVAPTPVAPAADADQYTIKPGDSLSLIAQQFRHARNASAQQAMVAIFRANPGAFINNNINIIKSQYTIKIPDAAQMQQLSASEARNQFNQLLTGAASSMPAPVIETTITSMPAEPVEPQPTPPPITETPAPPPVASTIQPEPMVFEQPEPPPEIVEPAPEPVPAELEDFRLRVSSDNADVTPRTIQQNAGTVVYEGPQTAAASAASPAPEIKQAMRAAVNDMETELLTLREEVKKLRQSLQGKDNLLALRSETRLRSVPAEDTVETPISETPASTAPEPVSAEAGDEAKPAVIELDTSGAVKGSASFDYVRLFLEILTLIAAVAFIGYLIVLQRKGDNEEDPEFSERLSKAKGFKALFKPARQETVDEVPEEDQEADLEDERDEPGRKVASFLPEEQESVRSFMRSQGKTQDGIEVSEEAYDESLDFSHADEDIEPEPLLGKTPTGEDINPTYLLQEANLSIAFSDLDNAYHLLIRLINSDPKNPEYRLLILRVLKDLLKEEEFIYHSNHLAKITNKNINSEWQQAYEYGLEFLPKHPLFSTPPTGIESAILASQRAADLAAAQEASAKAALAQAASPPSSPDNVPLDDVENTVVLDTRKALAEHERRMKQQAGKPASRSPQADETSPDSSNLAGSSGVTQNEDKPFHLNIGALAEEIENTAIKTEISSSGDSSIDTPVREGPISGEYQVNEIAIKGAQRPKTRDEEHIIEFDSTPTIDQAADKVRNASQTDAPGNVVEFDAQDSSDEPDSRESMAKELEDHLTDETLASMAEFAAIEGITLDEELLNINKRLKGKNSEEK
jgi:FimV-like protein